MYYFLIFLLFKFYNFLFLFYLGVLIFLDDLNRANKKLQQIENNNNTDVPTSSEIECNKRRRKPNKRYQKSITSSSDDEEFTSSILIRPKKLSKPNLFTNRTTSNEIPSSSAISSNLLTRSKDFSRSNIERGLCMHIVHYSLQNKI